MKYILKSVSVKIPEGVTVDVKHRVVTVKGKRGTLTKAFKHVNVDINVVDDVIKVDCWFANRKAGALVKTVCSHIKNMCLGTMRGFEYRMKVCYAHFPTTTTIAADKKSVEIRNFLGEKRVRRIEMLDGVTIDKNEASKDELVIAGNDVEMVSLSAALIN